MSKALIIVDVQNDFISGSLAVPNGGVVARRIYEHVVLAQRDGRELYNKVFTTQDWHIEPGSHWAQRGEDPDYKETWPVHCRAGEWGSELHPAITAIEGYVDRKFYKGLYSAAYSGTESTQPLRMDTIQDVYVCGLALDFCVFETAFAIAARTKFRPHRLHNVHILTDLSAAINEDTVLQQAIDNPHIKYVKSHEVL